MGVLRVTGDIRSVNRGRFQVGVVASLVLPLFVGCDSSPAPRKSGTTPATASVSSSETAPVTSNAEPLAAKPLVPRGKLVDLTHAFDAATIYWPTEQGFRFEAGNNGVTAKGYYYSANRFATAEHGGTHLDAPIHFAAERHTADQVELDRLMAEAAVIDVAKACAANVDYQISVGDLRAWEEKQQRKLDSVIVLLRTGWSQYWPDRLKYLGTEAHGPEAVAQLHFPGLSPEAARWLVEERNVKAVGIDTASIDFGQSTHFETHVTFCTHNLPIFENVTNLDQLPVERSLVIALPIKIAGGSGGPLRIIAVVPE